MNSAFTFTDVRAAPRTAGEATRCHQSPTWGAMTHNWEESQNYGTFPWGARGVSLKKEPQSVSAAPEGKPWKCLAFKPKGSIVWRTIELEGKENHSQKTCVQTHSGISHKVTVWEVPGPYMKETNLLILATAREAETCWGSL